jgi:hypothetical protein
MSKLAYLTKRVEMAETALLTEMAKMEKFGEDSDYEDFTVLLFDYKYNSASRAYTFVALKVAGGWYLTSKFTDRMTWDELVEKYLSKAEDIYYVSEWTEF